MFSDGREDVRLERWAPGTHVSRTPNDGIEILVLEGSLVENGENLTEGSWLRLPKGRALSATAGPAGVRFWTKRDHLAVPPRAPGRT